MHTQGNEEFFILEHFKGITDGVFIDLGAHDGNTFSNTKALYDLGWRGTYVECSPKPLIVLFDMIKERMLKDDIVLFTSPVADYMGQVTLYESDGDLLSSLSKDHVEVWNKQVQFYPVQSVTIPIHNVLDVTLSKFKQIDFISIDIEGISHRVLESCLSVCSGLVCVEHDAKRIGEITEIGKHYGFKKLAVTENNILLKYDK